MKNIIKKNLITFINLILINIFLCNKTFSDILAQTDILPIAAQQKISTFSIESVTNDSLVNKKSIKGEKKTELLEFGYLLNEKYNSSLDVNLISNTESYLLISILSRPSSFGSKISHTSVVIILLI